jgi:hypothetical protein
MPSKVLISPTDWRYAVWLTSDPTAADHGLALDPERCDELSRERGRPTRMVNKLAVRISVKIPPSHRSLRNSFIGRSGQKNVLTPLFTMCWRKLVVTWIGLGTYTETLFHLCGSLRSMFCSPRPKTI